MKTIGILDSEVVAIKAQDSNKDIKTNTCFRSVPDNIDLSQSVSLLQSWIYVGARVMLTDNVSVFDKLINGLGSTVKHLDMRSKPFFSKIYVKFDDSKAGNWKIKGLWWVEGICINYCWNKEVSFKEKQK